MSNPDESKISNFLNGKPEIGEIQRSSLFSRLQTFLPQMSEANQNMPSGASADAFQIENKDSEDDEDSDSSDDDDSEKDDDEHIEDVEKEEKPATQQIEIDLDVFLEQNSKVDGRDVSVQSVDSLPAAFQSKVEEEKPKKPLIEEI